MFAKWVFRLAGWYGILVITPLYFAERWVGITFPPAVTHPEFYYGFAGVTLAWQIVFLVMSTDPPRYRQLMPVAVLEKAPYVVAILCLYLQHRVASGLASGAVGDLIWTVLFTIAYLRTPAIAR